MTDFDYRRLEERVAGLERAVEQIRHEVDRLSPGTDSQQRAAAWPLQ